MKWLMAFPKSFSAIIYQLGELSTDNCIISHFCYFAKVFQWHSSAVKVLRCLCYKYTLLVNCSGIYKLYFKTSNLRLHKTSNAQEKFAVSKNNSQRCLSGRADKVRGCQNVSYDSVKYAKRMQGTNASDSANWKT